MDGSEAKSLESKGILKNGALDAAAAEVFEVVAKGTGAARLAIQDDKVIVEKYVYRMGEKYVQIDNDMGDLSFKLLLEFDMMMIYLSEFVGMGKMKIADIEVEAASKEMLVLFALVDAYRKNNLLYQGGAAELHDTYDEKAVADALFDSKGNSMTKILIESYGYEPPEKADVKKLLESLKEKGLVEGDYRLNDELAEMARSMLVPKAMVVLELFSLDEEGEVTFDTGLAFVAGLRDIIYLSMGDEEINLLALSGEQLLSIVEHYLRCPEIKA